MSKKNGRRGKNSRLATDKRRIVAGMATIPGRREATIEAAKSLVDQVDSLFIYVNGDIDPHEYYPELIEHINITFYLAKDFYGDLGDAGKLAPATVEMKMNPSAYFFAVDDDLIYPSDYCLYLVSKMKAWDNEKVVGFHGKRFDPPISSFYRDRHSIQWFHNQQALYRDRQVHCLGTGICAFPLGLVRIQIHDLFRTPRNAADLHLAALCQEQKIGMIVVSHTENALKLSPHIDHANDTIWAASRNHDEEHTRYVNEREWYYH